MSNPLNIIRKTLKGLAFWSFFFSFLTVAVVTQQAFIKDLSASSRTAETILESNALVIIKKWNVHPSYDFDFLDPKLFLIDTTSLSQIYSTTQDEDKSQNICVFDFFNLPPPSVIS